MQMPEKHSLFKNKKQMIIYITLFFIFLLGFIYFGSLDYTKSIDPHKEFSKKFPMVSENNVFTTVNASSAYNYIKSNNVVLLFGSNNEWVEYYASILNETALEVGIDKIFFYDITNDRYNNNGTYEAIVEYLKDYVTYTDNNKKDIYTPALLVKKDGKIILYDDDTAVRSGESTPESYWLNYQINSKKYELKEVFRTYLGE